MSFINFTGLSSKSPISTQEIPHSPFNKSFQNWMQRPCVPPQERDLLRSVPVRYICRRLWKFLISLILKNRLAQSLPPSPQPYSSIQKPVKTLVFILYHPCRGCGFLLGLALVGWLTLAYLKVASAYSQVTYSKEDDSPSFDPLTQQPDLPL